MKYLMMILLVLGTSSASAFITGSGLIYVCLHGSSVQPLRMYAVTYNQDSCPVPPPFEPTPAEVALGKLAHIHSGSVPVQPNHVIQHDPDCVVKKNPEHF